MNTPQTVRSHRAALFGIWCTLRSLRLPTSSPFFAEHTLFWVYLVGTHLKWIQTPGHDVAPVILHSTSSWASNFPTCVLNSDFVRSGRKLFTCSLPFHQARSLKHRSPTYAVCTTSRIVLPLHMSHVHEDGCQSLTKNVSWKSMATQAETSASAVLDVVSLSPPRLHTCTLQNRSRRRRTWESPCGAKQQTHVTCSSFLVSVTAYFRHCSDTSLQENCQQNHRDHFR